jgi:pre-mRNA-splicing factor CWC26
LPARREASDLPHARAPAEPPVVGAASRTFSAPGLHTNVQSEVAALQAERASQLRATDATVLGAGAETVYRGKDGRELDFATEVLKAGAGAGEKPSNAPAWGGGLRQKQADEEKRAHLRAESGKAFARYADDKELDDHMRHTARWGDPLADRVGRDKAATAAAALRPKYGKAGPPNRFGIQPGHRWDGVDRSNGFEKAFFSMQSNASLRKQAAHAWSTEDM